MKKFVLIILVALIASAFVACSSEQPPIKIGDTTQAEPTVEPIVLDVILSEQAVTFGRQIDDYIDPELLENQFDFYGLADFANRRYTLVRNDRVEQFTLDETGAVLTAPSGREIPCRISGDKLLLEARALTELLGLEIVKNDHLRIIKAADVQFNKAIFSGTAYRDYSKLESEKYSEKEVDIVNIAEGFALIIIDQKPYLTSELNLTLLQQELTTAQPVVERPLVLAWDLKGNKSDQTIDALIDVVVPVWLSLQDASGNVNDLYRPQYAANVKRQGAKLWVLVNNGFDRDLTAQFLADSMARQNFVDQMVNYVTTNQIDGINLDFENMYLKDSDRYVQLAAELHAATQKLGIPLSVAVTVPGGSENWSLVYDRRRLAKLTEYVTLMAYDQHWENSQTSGPVAGLSWVDENIAKTLEMVPANKLLLGLPFYTRIWYERLSTELPNKMKVRSKSVFMSAPRKLIDNNEAVRVWDEENSQYYFAFFEGDSLVKFWYDDPAAVARKAALFKKYNLAGIACWSLGFESADVWPALKDVVTGE